MSAPAPLGAGTRKELTSLRISTLIFLSHSPGTGFCQNIPDCSSATSRTQDAGHRPRDADLTDCSNRRRLDLSQPPHVPTCTCHGSDANPERGRLCLWFPARCHLSDSLTERAIMAALERGRGGEAPAEPIVGIVDGSGGDSPVRRHACFSPACQPSLVDRKKFFETEWPKSWPIRDRIRLCQHQRICPNLTRTKIMRNSRLLIPLLLCSTAVELWLNYFSFH